jgi:hypothetical protein
MRASVKADTDATRGSLPKNTVAGKVDGVEAVEAVED